MTAPTAKSASIAPCQWQPATWDDYLLHRNDPAIEKARLFFHQGHLWIDMGGEGINHSSVSNLFSMLLAFWFSQHPEQAATSLGHCQIERPRVIAAAPDLILYLGDDYPRWQPGESRYINLDRSRAPDLVGEISDTTLADDLDAKKRIYEELAISEYWVVNMRGGQVFAFRLQNGKYQQIEKSIALAELPISLLEEAIDRLATETNINAALWFSQEISDLRADLRKEQI